MSKNIQLGFTASSIQKIIEKNDWVKIYKNELENRIHLLLASHLPERYFKDSILSVLKKNISTANISNSKWYIRDRVAKRMQICHLKAFSLFKITQLIQEQLESSLDIYKKYESVPIGYQDSITIKAMSETEIKNWREGSRQIFFCEASISNVMGIFVSELFFTLESMLRVICIGSCIEFALKSILPNNVIQHDEIHKTLKRIGNPNTNKIACKLCVLKEKCENHFKYSPLALIYELVYHIRAIRDYKREFYFNDNLTDFIVTNYVGKGLDIIFYFDLEISKLYKDYLIFPYTLSEMFKNLKNKPI